VAKPAEAEAEAADAGDGFTPLEPGERAEAAALLAEQ